MNRSRRSWLVALPALAIASAIAPLARAQSMMEGMDSNAPINIKDDHERQLFGKLLCTCGGCQREAIVSCTCNVAADRREEVRKQIAKGMSDDDILTAYVKRYGTEAAAVPPNEGKQRLVYLVPLVAIVGMSAFLIRFLGRLRDRGAAQALAASSEQVATKGEKGTGKRSKKSEAVASDARDDYDDRLDDELKDLD